jgi:hypothetical protein
LSPTALEEIDVVTGGFGADNGAALSGIVNYTTRRGNADRWESRFSITSDNWMPDDLSPGFSMLSTTVGGPIGFLGRGSTIFADVLAQGKVDSDPRARGLTCLQPDDGDEELAGLISSIRDRPATRHLYCPYTLPRLPYQRGDKLLAFTRIDRPLGRSANLTFSLLFNRRQQELYTPEFKYNPDFQLGQRHKGLLGTLSLDWTHQAEGRVYRLTTRAAAMRLDRHLGVVDPWTFDARARTAGFGFADFRFLGEDFVRSPIERQLESGAAVPGYVRPGGVTGSPFGPAAEGIFFTNGTPQLANWNRLEFLGGDIVGEVLTTSGHSLRAGAMARLYRVESYERVLASLPGSVPDYARFYPRRANAWSELSLLAMHNISIRFGLRLEAFQAGLKYQPDASDAVAPTIDTEWKVDLLPRLGVAVPIPGSRGRTMFRFNYGLAAQPPDFRFFLDTTLGDSLRTDIRRQGNPNLSFEKSTAWEAGLSHLVSDNLSVSGTLFLKELTNLVTSGIAFSGFGTRQFTTGDFGSVKGLELTMQARWTGILARLNYALQDAKGVTSSAFEEPGGTVTTQREEFPLAFDRRHSLDGALGLGRPAGGDDKWGAMLTVSVRSGYPLDRTATVADGGSLLNVGQRLPWTYQVNLRVTREFGSLPGCGRCRWRLLADARNLLDTKNTIALRRDTGTVAPSAGDVLDSADDLSDSGPIPRESPAYSALIDLDSNGLITADELRTGRIAASLDRNDPSLYFGEALSLRLGLELEF